MSRQLATLQQTLLEQPAQVRNAHLLQLYQADPGIKALRSGCATVAPAEVRDLFAATVALNFYLRDTVLLRRLQCLLARLQVDGSATQRDFLKLHAALLAQRRFAQANALRKEHMLPVELLARISGARSPARQVLQLQGERRALRRDLPTSGWRVIAIVHPWCGFSSRASAALAQDPAWAELRPLLQMVVPDAQDWPVQDMLAWNHAHPDLPMQPMLGSKAWNVLDVSSTPTFHLMHDGVLVESRSGWRGDGAELLPLLQRMKNAE